MVEVVWSKQAIRHRNQLFNYWNQRNASTAYSKKLRLLITISVSVIRHFPKIGKPTSKQNVRIKIIRHYYLIYQVSETQIRILDFWDSRQHPVQIEHIIG